MKTPHPYDVAMLALALSICVAVLAPLFNNTILEGRALDLYEMLLGGVLVLLGQYTRKSRDGD